MDHQHNGLGDQPGHLFDNFVKAGTCKSILSTFHQLCDLLELKHANHHHFYRRLSSRLTSWKAQSLWAKLNKRYSQKEYRKAEGCANTRVLVIGCGPCGLRTAIEAAFLGCKVVLLEKRDSFSRNNVLHLWPYLITDLRNLGAKKFFGKFCAGAIDHISIRQLQCILMKVALILGVEIHLNVAFEGLVEPVEDEDHKVGWRCLSDPSEHVVSEYEFDVLIGADGKRNTLHGFKRKEFRGKLAIAITANFINRNTQEEARVEEISGVAFIFNQKFFKDLNRETGIDLENIVYYKDDTHYFVMTAKKNSLLDKGVLKNDYTDTAKLLSPANVNRDALLEYAKEAADFSTNNQLPQLEYAINHYGQPDVAMFDFTSMFAALNASRVIDRNGHQLLMGLVGDSLLEPFWPTGSGCARGFLGAFDAAWMIRSWSLGRMTPLQVIAERESIYQLLSQTTPENLNKNYNEYTIDPNTRYPNMNTKLLKTEQVRHLYDCGNEAYKDEILNIPAKRARNEESAIDSYTLLHWCQRVLNYKFRHVHVVDLTSSWRSGLALCALIQTFKPGLIEFNALSSLEIAQNNQLAFDVAQKDLGISPVMTGAEMASCATPDKLTMVSYLSQFYHKFRRERNPSVESPHHLREERGPKSPLHKSLLQKIRNSARFSRSKKKKDEEKNEHNTSLSKRKYNDDENQMNGNVKLTKYNKLPMDEIANKLTVDQTRKDEVKQNDVLSKVKVSAMAEILVSKFKSHNTTEPSAAKTKAKNPGILLAAQPESEICYFCQKRVYIMERMNAENVFFHRGCLKCDFCYTGLRVTNYSCERSETGQVKFYCFRHSRPELRKVRTRRKRMFVDDETAKENIPKVIIDGTDSPKLSQRKDFQESPKKIPTPLSPPLQPETDYVKAKKTPERIEFENSIDGLQEESEEELTEHNLRASLSYDAGKNIDDEFSDSDLESSDDEELQEAVESTYGHAVNKDLTLEEALFVVETLKRKSHENLIEAVENEGKYEQEGEEDESDSEEESGSEGDAESETEDMDVAETSSPERPHPKLFINIDSPQSHVQTAQKHARANFFTTPPEPVRLDPWKMFGMGKKEEETQQIESPTHEAVPEDAEINGENVKEDVDKMDDRREESEEEIKNDEMAEFDEKENDEEDEEMDIKKYEQTESSVNESDMEENEDEKEQVNEEVEQAEVYEEVKQAEAYEEVEQVVANEEDEQAEVDEVVEQAEEGEEEIKDEECDDVFDDVEDEDDKQALEKQMEMILADIDHKSSISDTADLKSSISDGSNARSSSVSDADQSANEDDEVFPSADDATEKAVLASVENMNSSASRSSQSIREEVLNSVRAMEEPEEEQNVDQALISIDDRFVTQGRGRSTKKKRQKQKFRKSFESDSSFTISTPSGSPHTSIGSLVDEQMLDEGEGPDHDMLEDYCLTLSQYLGESYGDENVPQESEDTPRPSELSPRVESIGVSPHDLDDTLLEEEEVVNDVNNSIGGSTNVNVGGRDSSAYVTPNESVSINERFFSMSDSENLNGSTSSRTSVSAIDNNIDEKPNHVCDSHVKSDANLLTSDKNKTVVLNSSVSKDKLSKSSELKTDTTLVSPSDNKLLNSDGSTWRPLPPIPGTASGKTTEPLKITGENKKVSSISSKATVVPKQKSVEKSEVSSRKLPDISKLKSSVNTQGFQSNFMRKHLGSPTGTDGSSSSKEGSSSPEFKYSSRILTSNSTISSSEDDQNKNKKTKVSVDHAKLKSFNSIDDSSSQGENLVGRKKIGVDTQLRERVKAEPVKSRVSVEHHIEDIPFADDSGDDLDDKFFTPATSVKNPPPKKEVVKTDVRKRILPMPPKMEDTPSMPSVEHIREVKKAEMESAREKARQKARLKSDEELGLTNMNYTPKMAGNLRKRNTDRTPSTSDFITDSDDAGKFLHSTPIDKTDLDKTPTKSAKSKKKKKDKDLTPHGSDKSDNEITSKVPYKKKKSLLQILKPNRSPEKSPKDMKDKRSSSNDTLDEKMPAKKKKTPKSDKKKKKKHASESALEHLDRDLSNLNLHGVTPRFLGEKGEKISSRRHPALRKPVAPRAELDEFSDSDESRVSIDTLSRKPRDRRVMSEDELNVRIARRVQSAARKQQKQREQKRLRMAQEIQRQLEEVDVKQKELEERGVVVEKALRGEGPDASRDESELMQEWFTLVYEKNALVRYESELMVNAQYMELEDRHGRLEQELREKMAASNGEKTAQQTVEEKRVLDELLEVVEERDKLVAMLEDDRVREREEDRDLEAIMNAKGFNLNPTDYAHNIKYKAQIFPLSC